MGPGAMSSPEKLPFADRLAAFKGAAKPEARSVSFPTSDSRIPLLLWQCRSGRFSRSLAIVLFFYVYFGRVSQDQAQRTTPVQASDSTAKSGPRCVPACQWPA